MLSRLYLPFLTVLLTCTVLTAQTETESDYYEAAADATCTCMADYDVTTMSTGEIEMQLGICMVTFAIDGRERYETLFGTLDMTDERSLTQLGENVGVKMMGVCPKVVMAAAGGSTGGQASAGTEVIGTFQGVTTAGKQAVVTVKVENGPPTKMLWLEYWPGSDDVEALKGKRVHARYEIRELYDAATESYLTQKVIVAVEEI